MPQSLRSKRRDNCSVWTSHRCMCTRMRQCHARSAAVELHEVGLETRQTRTCTGSWEINGNGSVDLAKVLGSHQSDAAVDRETDDNSQVRDGTADGDHNRLQHVIVSRRLAVQARVAICRCITASHYSITVNSISTPVIVIIVVVVVVDVIVHSLWFPMFLQFIFLNFNTHEYVIHGHSHW